jgi:hypothetical protein
LLNVLKFFKKLKEKLKSYFIEVTEEENGCHIRGYLVSEPKIHKILPVGTSMGIVIPAEILPRYSSCSTLKIHVLEQFEGEPIIVLTHPDKVLEVGAKNAK